MVFSEPLERILILPVKGDGEPAVRFPWISPTEEAAPHPFVFLYIQLMVQWGRNTTHLTGLDCKVTSAFSIAPLYLLCLSIQSLPPYNELSIWSISWKPQGHLMGYSSNPMKTLLKMTPVLYLCKHPLACVFPPA